MAVSKITRVYQNFAGVDFKNDDIALNRSPDSLNMWKDYGDSDGVAIETRPDIVLEETYPANVYGIFYYKVGVVTYKVVHAGAVLYSTQLPSGTRITLFTGMNPFRSQFFVFNNVLYIKDGLNYLQYNGSTCTSVSGYIPTTSIARKPAGGGTTLEDVNLLTGERINTFVGDGTSTEYFVDSPTFDSNYTEIIKINGVALVKGTDFTVDSSLGKITFVTAPPEPATVGQPNVSVQFRKTISGYRDRILKCTILTVFDNRIFFSGNQDYPNVLFHSSLNDPSYCSDLDYYNEGMDLSKIRAVVSGNNSLWVFKEPSPNGDSVYYHQPTVDSTYGKIYPSQRSNLSFGCVSTGVNFNDDICFFSPNGLEAISGDVTKERATMHRSSLVDAKLLAEEAYTNVLVEEYKGYLMVFAGTHVYLADSRQMFQATSHFEYEWYFWEIEETVLSTRVHNDILYLGTSSGVYVLSGAPVELSSYWTTPEDEFGAINMLKTTDKRGGLVNFGGSYITVHSRKDNGAFSTGTTYQNVKGYAVYRIREKKFKHLQLKFSSTVPIKIYSASIEAYVGNYVKR